jgi:addiction module HigA family antidote
MPRPAIHPGEILRDELLELGVTPTELSRQIDVPPNRVTEIIHGRRSITGDTALRLGQWFGSSARFWLNLQGAYDIRTAEKRAGQEIKQLKRRPDAMTGGEDSDAALAALAKAVKVKDISQFRKRDEQPAAQKPLAKAAAKPAVPPKKSITSDYIICLEDGRKFKSLKRHLRTHYNLSPEEYREKWGLPSDYPMVAPAYAKARAALAKQIGLGVAKRRA